MSDESFYIESGVTRNAVRSERFKFVPPHLRHNLSPVSAPHSVEVSFGARDIDRLFPRNRHGRGWASQKLNPSVSAADEVGNLRISDPEDNATSDGFANGIDFNAYDDIPVETSGSDVPPPVTTFTEIDLGDALNSNILRCRYVKPTPVQRYAIPISLAGRDLMACAQTGSGKTAAFCFPIISAISKRCSAAPNNGFRHGGSMACPLALVLSPTRELSCQIHDEAKKFSYHTGVRIAVVYGGAPAYSQLRDLAKGVDILVATPGRLIDLIEKSRISLQRVNYLALDEADRMLDMGFEPQIRKIVEQMNMPPPGSRQTMLFSATFPHAIRRLASDFLSNYIFLTVGRVGSSTELIKQKVEYVLDTDKRNHLINLLLAEKTNGSNSKQPLTLVFVETKRSANSLQNWLCRRGFPATAIHGDRTQPEREQALRSFKSGTTPVMVATDVAARGIDIPHVAHVINFDLPRDIDGYVHRIGRTGRAGKSGLATAFFSNVNQPLAKALVDLMKESYQEVPDWLSELAERPSYGRERSRHSGESRFGGHDFRNGARQQHSFSYGDELYPHGSSGSSSCGPSYGGIAVVGNDSSYPQSANDAEGSGPCSYAVHDGNCISAGDHPAGVRRVVEYKWTSNDAGYDQIVPTGWD